MDILEQIIQQKRREIDQRRHEISMQELEQRRHFHRQTNSLAQSISKKGATGIIAEFKRQSPSKGIINSRSSVEDVVKAYAAFGASGISVLTDAPFFGGSLEDLAVARNCTSVPLLRKDFIIDEYQLVEAKTFGADVILLIAACLSPVRVKELAETAKQLGLEVLLEIHDEPELDHICNAVDLVGVNNRNLKTFEVNLEHSICLAEKIDRRFVKIAESGISNVENIQYLKQHGFQGFLIGEHFMSKNSPMDAFKHFVAAL